MELGEAPDRMSVPNSLEDVERVFIISIIPFPTVKLSHICKARAKAISSGLTEGIISSSRSITKSAAVS